MYVDHDLDVTPWINRGRANTLAVKVTPERALQDIDGVELADSWFDWINWNYLGYQGPEQEPGQRQFVRAPTATPGSGSPSTYARRARWRSATPA